MSFTTPATSSSTSGLLQFTGLASGLDTTSIINSLMAVERQPLKSLQAQQQRVQAESSQLTSIRTALQTMVLGAQALGDPGLFTNTQSATSSNPAQVSAAVSTGAAVGFHQVGVTALANSAQRTFTFASPGTAAAISIDGHTTNLAAGAGVQDFVNAINSDSSATVWAASTGSGNVVLSDRATGNNSSYIQVSDPSGTLTEQPSLAQPGSDASYTIDGNSATSPSNTLTSAIPGVTLTLNSTTAPGPVTVTVSPPAPNASSIQAAVKSFVDSYNATVTQIRSQLTQTTSTSDPTAGTLFGDMELSGLLDNMRQTIGAPGAGLPVGAASLADFGISTGAASGSNPFSQDAVDGKLTIDATALAKAISSNPGGVKAALSAFADSFATVVNSEAAPGGTLDSRIQGDGSEASDLGNQISALNDSLAIRQQALQAEFTALETTLSKNQTQSSWLTAQLASLKTS
jgi:flagellar hook-associated protein 2